MSVNKIDDCWNRIGVRGDKSCSELARHIHCRNCSKFEQGALDSLDRPAPSGYLGEWTGLLAGTEEVAAGLTDAAVVFRIGAEWLALNARLCVEIVALRPVRPVPHRSGRIFLGLTGVRGELLLCFSLADLLGLTLAGPADAHVLPRLIVANKDRFAFAFPVDEVMGLCRYQHGALREVPATVAHAVPRFTRGMLEEHGRAIGLLDEELVLHALTKALG